MFINVGNKPLGNGLQEFDPALNKLSELCFPTFLLVDQFTAGPYRDPPTGGHTGPFWLGLVKFTGYESRNRD